MITSVAATAPTQFLDIGSSTSAAVVSPTAASETPLTAAPCARTTRPCARIAPAPTCTSPSTTAERAISGWGSSAKSWLKLAAASPIPDRGTRDPAAPGCAA
jgi:hypothetical protein